MEPVQGPSSAALRGDKKSSPGDHPANALSPITGTRSSGNIVSKHPPDQTAARRVRDDRARQDPPCGSCRLVPVGRSERLERIGPCPGVGILFASDSWPNREWVRRPWAALRLSSIISRCPCSVCCSSLCGRRRPRRAEAFPRVTSQVTGPPTVPGNRTPYSDPTSFYLFRGFVFGVIFTSSALNDGSVIRSLSL